MTSRSQFQDLWVNGDQVVAFVPRYTLYDFSNKLSAYRGDYTKTSLNKFTLYQTEYILRSYVSSGSGLMKSLKLH